MAEKVTIDIPNIGKIEAENAASEATLLKLLKVMDDTKKEIKAQGKGKKGKGGKADEPEIDTDPANKRLNELKNKLTKAGAAAGSVAGSFSRLAIGSTKLIDTMANVGDSLTGAASALNAIPVVGGVLASVFGAVAGAVETSTKAYQSAASAGATFGGSVNSFSRAASAAGMTMEQFGSLIAQSGEALRFLGGNTEDGAKRFASMSSELRQTSKDLYDLGYSTKDVNEGLANYTKLAMQGGRGANMTNQQLVAGTKTYLKEMDLLAKVTGETRKQQEDAQAKLAADAQYQAAMAGMSEDVASSFRNTVTGLPGPLRDVAKDIMATGNATTEEAQRFTAMMPQSAAMMREFAEKTQRGEQISLEERNKLNNMLREEGKAAQTQYKDIGRYSKEFATQTQQFTAATNIGKDALKGAAKAQAEAKEMTDGQAYAMEKSKQALAEFSNQFMMQLAGSGLLPVMMQAFTALASFVTNFVVPAFKVIVPILTDVVGAIATALMPTFEFLGGMVKGLAEFIAGNVTPILAGLAVGFGLYYGVIATQIALETGRAAITAIGNALEVARNAGLMASIGSLLGFAAGATGATLPLLPFAIAAGVVVGGLVLLWKYLGKMGVSFDTVTDGLTWMWSMFKTFLLNLKLGFLKVLDYLPGVDMKDAIEETENDLLDNAKERADIETKIAKDMSDKKKKIADEEEKDRKKKKAAEASSSSAAPSSKQSTETPSGPNYDNMSPEDVLKKVAIKEKSDIVPTKEEVAAAVAKPSAPKEQTKTATTEAEATKQKMANDAQKAKDDNAKDEEAKKTKEETTGTGSKPKTTQESTETLLATLNTQVAELIKVTKQTQRVSEKQLSVQEGLNNDLFSNASIT